MEFWKKIFSIICTWLLIGLVLQLQAQVLTLNQYECIKVNVKFSEILTSDKYERININTIDIPQGKSINQLQNQKKESKPAIKVEDNLVAFFIWKQNVVLRVITREEINKNLIAKLDNKSSLPLSSLAVLNFDLFYNSLNKIQKNKSCTFIHKPAYSSNLNYILDVQCLPLMVKNNLKSNECYRIINLSVFSINHNIQPELIFHNQNAGFTINEQLAFLKTKPKDWIYYLKIIYNSLFLYEKENLINESLPYLAKEEIKQWPWVQAFSIKSGFQGKILPFYLGNSIVGYQVNNKQINPETEGSIVVPGKFFLPQRLKIISVNDIPWKN